VSLASVVSLLCLFFSGFSGCVSFLHVWFRGSSFEMCHNSSFCHQNPIQF
jgi:hypothetical protein